MWTDDIDEVKYWDEYLKVNEIFAKEVVKNYQPGDISK
jgi:trehalose 6-phosphate synthase/phosphatase